ncbi:hypothetical protein PVAND_009046 [Polypedilum vanderplanki]|uniref:Uncharacterized protein n=1 Tax=Polypedilum vanderplanki TaxID=319348 RepID=A0A9J6CBF8_POLVA|nr:hypothetical protein PVAND_009046 [Polypedilum vanderplanki]
MKKISITILILSVILIQKTQSIPDDWSTSCVKPSKEICNKYPDVYFPHPDLRLFWTCWSGISNLVHCPCDHLFDLGFQRCVPVHQLNTFFCRPIINFHPTACDPNLCKID